MYNTMNHTISKSNIHKICRICLVVTEKSCQDSFKELLNKLQYCIGIKLEEDVTLPSIFCDNCSNTINVMYNFKELCLYSQQILSDIVKYELDNNKTEEIHLTNNGNVDEVETVETKPNVNMPLTTLNDDKHFNYENKNNNSMAVALSNSKNCKPKKPVVKRNKKFRVKCPSCDKQFKSHRTKRRHMQFHIPKEKRLNYCSMCNKAYIQMEKLIEHQKSHEDNKIPTKGQCNICGKTLLDVQKHILKMHTDNRPYECSKCDSKFAFKVDLYLHVNRVHYGPRKKTLLCPQCGSIFRDRYELKEHLYRHTGEKPYQCSICNFKCGRKSILRRHIETHNENRVKRHSCTYCDKKFTSGTLLRSHIRSHTGERPYACKLCDKRYTQRGSLRLHLKSHQLMQQVRSEISYTVDKIV